MVAHFPFFREGVFRKKLLPATPPRFCFAHSFIGKFAPTSQSSFPGALLCDLKTIMMLQSCFLPTLMSFTRRHPDEPQTDSIVRRRVFGRPSSLVLHCEPNRKRCAGSSSRPVAARRPAFFRLSRAVAASARITAASLSSPGGSSRCNRRFCFLTKPNSACRIPSLMTVA